MMKRISGSRGALAAPIILLLLTGLSGCGSMEPLPSDTFYRLRISPGVKANSNEQQWTEKAIRVAKFRASGVHRERAIVFAESDQIVVKQHRYHLWLDSPERLLQDELVSYLRAARVAPAISAHELDDVGLEIKGQIRQMDHVITADGTSVVVALAFDLVRREPEKSLVLGAEYRESRTISGNEMGSVASAISDAVGVIFERFVTDAGDALRH